MNLKIGQIQKFIIWPLLFIVIALWNIPHTIAGRYISEGLLLLLVIGCKPNWKLFFGANKPLLIFFTYLFIQLLFFSTNYPLAFSNFRAEWMHFIIFSMIGAGAGLLLGKSGSVQILLFLGIAFSTPLYIHLVLSLIKGIELGSIPWGYWGISEIHGDFGYPALEASILLFTFYLYKSKTLLDKILLIGLLIICVASPLLATSRGGTAFAILGTLCVYITHLLSGHGNSFNFSKKLIYLLIFTLGLLGSFKLGIISIPDRWVGTFSRLSVGLQGDPVTIYCKGIHYLEQEFLSKGISITPEIQKGLDSVVDGEGTRAVAARSGYSLMLQHPMGLNQSKQAYQTAIIEACNGSPKIFIAHAHNGWIDTALAIGMPGAILLLITLLQYAKLGLNSLRKSEELSPFGMALFVSACIWMLRGLLDSTFRDQMLEMQAFIFAFLLGVILTKNSLIKNLIK